MNQKIQRLSEALAATRLRMSALESQLQEAVDQELKKHGSALELAKRLGFSAQFLSDIRHGRRKVSADFVERLRGLDGKSQ